MTLTDNRARRELKEHYLPEYNRVTKSKIKSPGNLSKYWIKWRKDFTITEIVGGIEPFYNQKWVQNIRRKEHKGADLYLRFEDSRGKTVNRIQDMLTLLEDKLIKSEVEAMSKNQNEGVKQDVQHGLHAKDGSMLISEKTEALNERRIRTDEERKQMHYDIVAKNYANKSLKPYSVIIAVKAGVDLTSIMSQVEIDGYLAQSPNLTMSRLFESADE